MKKAEEDKKRAVALHTKYLKVWEVTTSWGVLFWSSSPSILGLLMWQELERNDSVVYPSWERNYQEWIIFHLSSFPAPSHSWWLWWFPRLSWCVSYDHLSRHWYSDLTCVTHVLQSLRRRWCYDSLISLQNLSSSLASKVISLSRGILWSFTRWVSPADTSQKRRKET
jgi:hypothetical protein